MLAPPPDFDIAELRAELEAGWGVRDVDLHYLAVGFGSHHWRVTDDDCRRWFVTLDEHRDSTSIADLVSAFSVASALSRGASLNFVLPPIPDSSGQVVRVIQGGRFTVAITPWLDALPFGEGPFTSAEQRSGVLGMVGHLHAATNRIDPSLPSRADLAVPDHAELRAAINNLDAPWTSGPFAEGTRTLVRDDLPRLLSALDRYEELMALVLADPAPWVVTHGEPHTANILEDTHGDLRLIDWDTARLAPRERDLWMVTYTGGDLVPYRAVAGDVPISSTAMRLFRMRWDLGEIALYVTQFRAVHDDDPNTREAWVELNDYLPVSDDHLVPVAG